jgi:pyridoxal biosynthesis lyase PdxS
LDPSEPLANFFLQVLLREAGTACRFSALPQLEKNSYGMPNICDWRMSAEPAAHFVKTYYCNEDFETVTTSCPVPVVMAGGKTLPELDALTMAHRAVSECAAGVDIGRNTFQSENPTAMIQAVGKVVHEGLQPKQAYEFYQDAKSAQGARSTVARCTAC